jgi:hypothetical protein
LKLTYQLPIESGAVACSIGTFDVLFEHNLRNLREFTKIFPKFRFISEKVESR